METHPGNAVLELENMSDTSKKSPVEDTVTAERRSLNDESIKEQAQLLGATVEEVIEAEEHSRTLDLDETKNVRHTDKLQWHCTDNHSSRKRSSTFTNTTPISAPSPSFVYKISSRTKPFSKIPTNTKKPSQTSRPKFPSSRSTPPTQKSVQ